MQEIRVDAAAAAPATDGGPGGYAAVISLLNEHGKHPEMTSRNEPDHFMIERGFATCNPEDLRAELATETVKTVAARTTGGSTTTPANVLVVVHDQDTEDAFNRAVEDAGTETGVEFTISMPSTNGPVSEFCAIIASWQAQRAENDEQDRSNRSNVAHADTTRRGMPAHGPVNDPLDPDDRWNKRWDRAASKFAVTRGNENAWESDLQVSETWPQDVGKPDMTQEEIRQAADSVIQRRNSAEVVEFMAGRSLNMSDQAAVELARPTIEAFIQQNQRHSERVHLMCGAHVLNRAYSAARIRTAGIDIDQHPEWKTKQSFYELGMRPMSLAEMADHIISTLKPEPAPTTPR